MANDVPHVNPTASAIPTTPVTPASQGTRLTPDSRTVFSAHLRLVQSTLAAKNAARKSVEPLLSVPSASLAVTSFWKVASVSGHKAVSAWPTLEYAHHVKTVTTWCKEYAHPATQVAKHAGIALCVQAATQDTSTPQILTFHTAQPAL